MDFLSDTARKEKRSLLATGCVGILVAWLGVNQTDIELAGFKFQDPHLPKLISLSLLAAITYFLAKFCSSYLYERFSSEMKSLATQISEGKTAMDINREEKEIMEASRILIEEQKTFQAQQENEKRRLAELQATIEKNDTAHEAELKSLDINRNELESALKEASGPNYVQIPSMNMSIDPGQIPQQILGWEKRKSEAIINRHNVRQNELEHLKDEENRSEANEKARQAKVKADVEALDLKRVSVFRWRQANKGAMIVGPLHSLLDVGLPILVGLTAIGFLTWFLFHLPPPSIPLSPPEF